MSSKRTGIILILIAALLFIVVAVVGPTSCGRGADPMEPPPWLAGMGDLLPDKPSIRAGEIESTCRRDDRIEIPKGPSESAGGPVKVPDGRDPDCTLVVGTADTTARSLPLTLEIGGPLIIRAEQNDEDRKFSAVERLARGTELKIDIFEGGATIEIWNERDEPARLRIGGGS